LTELFGAPVKTYENTLRLQKSALTSGWHTAKVYRASFEEVKKPRATSMHGSADSITTVLLLHDHGTVKLNRSDPGVILLRMRQRN